MPEQDAAAEPQRPSVGRRLAAMVAMAALVAAAAIFFVGVVVHLVAVILAFISLLVCATGGWYAVSRRGVVRVIAMVVVVASVAAFGTALFFADLRIWRVVLIVVLGGASVLAAKYALERTRRQLRANMAHLAAAGSPAHPVLIMNLKSGGGKAERFHLAEECRKRGIEPVVLRPEDDLLQLAEDAIARGADVMAWRAATAPRRRSPRSPRGMISRTCAYPRAPGTISRSTSGWIATTWWARLTRSRTGWSAGSTWPPLTAGRS